MGTNALPTTVAVLGLGTMGGPTSAALTERFTVHGFDPDPTTRDVAVAADVVTFDSAAAAVADAEVVILSLPTPEIVRSVVDELGRHLTGKFVIDLSTVGPDTARAVARQLGAIDARYADAPILGRPDGCGAWTLPTGGTEAEVNLVADVAVGTIARSVHRVGDVGSGALLKVLNNLIFGAINTVTAEVIDIAERSGLDPSDFIDVVGASGAASVSPLFTSVAPKMAASEYFPTFPVRLLHSDVRLGVELAAAAGSPAPISAAVERVTAEASRLGFDDQDTAAVIEVYRARR